MQLLQQIKCLLFKSLPACLLPNAYPYCSLIVSFVLKMFLCAFPTF